MRALAVCLAAAALAGCASAPPVAVAPDAPPVASEAPAAASAPEADLEALYWQRQAAARQRFTDADVAFMTGMIGHHAQALVMARLAPTHGASPAVRRLAARILNAQRDEIATMQRWLRDRGQPVPVVTEAGETRMPPDPHAGHAMPGTAEPEAGHDAETHARHVADGTHARHQADGTHAAHHDAAEGTHSMPGHDMAGHDMAGHDDGMTPMDHAGMPGMLSQAQMDELEAARGVAFDRLFLRYMIQHHGGAVTMVNALFEADGAANDEDAFKVASDVQVDQRTEIARMQQMLDALPPDDSDR